MEERIKELEREKRSGEKKIAQLQTKISKANADLKEEREVRVKSELGLVRISSGSVGRTFVL